MDQEQVKSVILYNKPVSQKPKKKYEKDEYAYVQESMRLMHNIV